MGLCGSNVAMQEMNKLVGAKRLTTAGKNQKYFLDDYGRQIIISGYSVNEPPASIAKKLQIPKWKVSEWAVQLGVSRHSSRKWTEKEIAYLKRNFYKKDIDYLAVRLRRPANAVRIQAYRLGLAEDNGYNKDQVGQGLGVNKKTVDKWIEKGWLKGRKKGDSLSDRWVFVDKDIRNFIITHPDEINPKKMDWLWVVDILAGEVGIGELGGKKARKEEEEEEE